MPTLKININSHDEMKPHVHGRHKKDVIVLHETVSPDINGMADVQINLDYLARIDYGIHGIVDKQGYIAWALGLGNAIFWQAGGVNERSIGIEQVSPIPELLDKRILTLHEAESVWKARKIQLKRVAALVACFARAADIPLKYSDGDHPGITTHWNVSQHHPESDGHTDCWPIQAGGYYPINFVIWHARIYKSRGLHF